MTSATRGSTPTHAEGDLPPPQVVKNQLQAKSETVSRLLARLETQTNVFALYPEVAETMWEAVAPPPPVQHKHSRLRVPVSEGAGGVRVPVSESVSMRKKDSAKDLHAREAMKDLHVVHDEPQHDSKPTTEPDESNKEIPKELNKNEATSSDFNKERPFSQRRLHKGYSLQEMVQLPSDRAWRLNIYFQLVAKQRVEIDTLDGDIIATDDGVDDEMTGGGGFLTSTTCPVWGETGPTLRQATVLEKVTNTVVAVKPQTSWGVQELAKASRLLQKQDVGSNHKQSEISEQSENQEDEVIFEDENEMRRVYSLLYDVLRYKNILNQALEDISFFHLHPMLERQHSRTWLLLYDLQQRKFGKRPTGEQQIADTVFGEVLQKIDIALWQCRVRLAAGFSRLRIENSALKLSELLPSHLQNEKLGLHSELPPVTGWVNSFKIKDLEELNGILDEYDLKPISSDSNDFDKNRYYWDSFCPQFMILHPEQRISLAKSPIVKNYHVIMQDKSFCFGPAVFANLLSKMELTGSVIQTHLNSPRATAYLCALLAQNPRITNLMAFSAGDRKAEFERYMEKLGVTNIQIHSERLIEVYLKSEQFTNVAAVFATPPNSYSAITDPIDLVCSRGGDLTMLEILTETTLNDEGKKRIANILDEQRLTLKYAMSRPQIQFVLYETHSAINVENEEMARRCILELNRIAHDHHLEMKKAVLASTHTGPSFMYRNVPSSRESAKEGKTEEDRKDESGNSKTASGKENKMDVKSDIEETKEVLKSDDINNNEEKLEKIVEMTENSETIIEEPIELQPVPEVEAIEEIEPEEYTDVQVPPCDLFEIKDFTEYCPDMDLNILKNEGCFLALLQRKEVNKFDNKYMIKMAESRGLFGGADGPRKVQKTSRQRKKEDTSSASANHSRNKKFKIEIDRIAAPTHASLSRCGKYEMSPEDHLLCARHKKHESQVPLARRWWRQTTKHVVNLHRALSLCQKFEHKTDINGVRVERTLPKLNGFIPNGQAVFVDSQSFLVSQFLNGFNIKPYLDGFPRLRLTREPHKVKKPTYPLHVNLVVFRDYRTLFVDNTFDKI